MSEENPLSSKPLVDDENDSASQNTFVVPQSAEEIKTCIAEMFNEHKERLLRMINVRLQPELRALVDPDDVLQESFSEAFRQLSNGVSAPKYSTVVWLRLIVGQQLVTLYRYHFQTQKRNRNRERGFSLQRSSMDPTSTSIFLVGQLTSPSTAACRHELQVKMTRCLERLDPADREIISLRNFEQLTNQETAEELGVMAKAASVMYLRALKRFRVILEEEGLDEYNVS